MNYRTLFTHTQYHPSSSHTDIDIGSPLITIGSCFSDNLSEYLKKRFWPVTNNPCGISYNPLSISSTLDLLAKTSILEQKDLFFHNDLWSSFKFHGTFSHTNPDASLDAMNNSIANARDQLQKTKYILISFGTAFGYFFKGGITNNCHKLSSSLFERRLITIDESVQSLQSSLNALTKKHPDIKVFVTVSPVRHLRDNSPENSLSKATLRCLCNELVTNNSGVVEYFPSYEIMMDELRDYRFYASDLVHPNETAVSIIMNRFTETHMSAESQLYFAEVEKLLKSIDHRPQNIHGTAFMEFQESMKTKITEFKKKYPQLHIYI